MFFLINGYCFLTLGTNTLPYLSATLVSLFQRSFLSQFLAPCLAPSLPFWDCKSTAFFAPTKFFLIFFLVFVFNLLIFRKIIFVIFLWYFCVIGGFMRFFCFLLGLCACFLLECMMYSWFFMGVFYKISSKKTIFRGRLNIFYNIPKV